MGMAQAEGEQKQPQVPITITIYIALPNPTTKKEAQPARNLQKAQFGGNGFAHGPPKNIPHNKCNYNKKWKGWRPDWVCKKTEGGF